jgi:tetratricopeptide (TPR) repeat protein
MVATDRTSDARGSPNVDDQDLGRRDQLNPAEPVTLFEALAATTPSARILLVVPSPINDPTRLHPETELREIYGALDQLRADVDIVRLDPPTIETLRVALAGDAFDVVHIATHCTVDTLEFEDEDGTAVHISCRELADVVSSGRPRLLVLNGCSTEAIADGIANVAQSVTTIAISGDIIRSDASRILRSIYELIFAGRSPREAAIHASNQLRRHRLDGPAGVALVTARGPQESDRIVTMSIGDARPTYYRCFPPTNLPPGTRAFFDRETETLRLHELLCGGETDAAVIGVTGITGTGKTALVRAAARRYGWNFPGGIGYFSLRGEFSVDLLSDVFNWVRPLQRDIMSVEQACRALSKGRYLLIFDDLSDATQPVLEEVGTLVGGWDTTLGGRTILISQSRSPELQALVGRNWMTVSRLPPDAAGELLLHCLPGSDAALRTVGADAQEVTNLCLGHPKTIESAASLLSLGQPWGELKEDLFRFAGQGPLSVNEEMLGRIVGELELRQPAVRDLLDAWSVFEERCREETWRRVAGGGVDGARAAKAAHSSALNELQGANLVDRYEHDGEAHCVMHPLVSHHLRPRHRGLSRDKLRRLVGIQLDEQMRLARSGHAGDYPLEEAGNVRRTLAVAAELGLWEPTLRYCKLIVGDENARLPRRGPWRLARELLELGVRASSQLGDDVSCTELLLVEGMVLYRLADFDRASSAFEQAVELADHTAGLEVKVRALRGSGQVSYRLGDYDAALALYTRARKIASGLGEVAAAAIDHQIGKILYRKHQLAEARNVLAGVRDVRSTVGPKRDLAKTIHELARVEQADGRVSTARSLYQEALKLEQDIGDLVMEQATLFQLGILALEENNLVDARQRFLSSRRVSERLDDQVWLVHAAWAEARMAFAEGAGDAVDKANSAIDAARTLHIGLAREIEEWLAVNSIKIPVISDLEGT